MTITLITPENHAKLIEIYNNTPALFLQNNGYEYIKKDKLTINGVLCGLAGAYLVLAQSANFSANMTAGRGFMALAALIFGRWHPVNALWACLLFGFLDAAAIRLQGVRVPGIGEVPVQMIQALPYVLTVVLLAGFIGKAVAPQALGKPYLKER